MRLFMSMRPLAPVLILFLSLAAPLASPAAQGPAEALVANLANQAIPVLTRSDLPEAQREAKFRQLLHEGFDMNQIARLVLGRYWNQATPEERAEFTKLLENYLVQLYGDRFIGYRNVTFQIQGSRDAGGDVIVNSVLLRPDGPPVALDWRVASAGGRSFVTDLVVEGVSMVITQRSEFASVINQRGGRVEGLLQLLRQRTGAG